MDTKNRHNWTWFVESYDSPVGVATVLWAGWSRVRILEGARDSSSPEHPDPLLGLPSLLFSGYSGSFLGDKVSRMCS